MKFLVHILSALHYIKYCQFSRAISKNTDVNFIWKCFLLLFGDLAVCWKLAICLIYLNMTFLILIECFFFFFVLFYQSNLVSIVWIFYIISRLSDDTSCDCWCFFYRFYITLLGLNHLQPSRFNCKVANLIMQIGCFQILLLLGMEFLRTWVMWRNWYVYDHYLIGITFISSTSYFFNQL